MRYNVLALIGLMGVVAILSSCEDDQRYGGREGETMQVAMTISTEFSGVESRAVFDSSVELEINNVTRCLLLIYNGTGNNATLEYVEEILDPTKFPLTRFIPTPAEGVSYRAIMLGNVLAEQLGDAAIPGAQLEDLNDYAYEINSGYNDPAANANITNFTWSSYPLDYTSETSTLGFTLNPNVAKVKVSITDNSTKSNIVKVQVKNVPNKVRFAQNALSKGGNFVDGTVEMTYIDYNIEELDLSDKKGKLQTLYWYLPHNQAGTGNRNTNPIDAPDNATWVEFDGMRTSDFLYSDYKIYPGEDEAGVTSYNNLKNFNIKADYQYRLNVNITDKGVTFNTTTKINETAAGVAVEKVKLPYNSNCYMIHPLGSRTASGTLYELPINRINEYWGATYGVNDASMQIGDNTEWEAYVIWQDIPQRAIYFADKDGNVNKTSTVYSGTGMTPIYFKLVNQNATSATQTYGNVLIGVRNKSTQTTLWSWHLWITDYNPDVAPSHSVASGIDNSEANALFALNTNTYNLDIQGVYNYNSSQIAQVAKANSPTTYSTSTFPVTYLTEPVSEGNVQHYHSNYSNYWNAPSKTLWDSGIYADKWIMDRNLGAQAAGNMHIAEPLDAWGLYYQFGRKDPFSYRLTFDIDGGERSGYKTLGKSWNHTTGGSISNGIKNPNTFYLGNTDTWAGTSAPNSNIWYNPKSINDGEKSVFDPCPPGWCVPDRDAFDFAENSSGTRLPTLNSVSISASAHALFYIYFDAQGSIYYPEGSDYATISLTKLRDKHRHMAMLCPSNTVGGNAYFLFTVFPMQGYITAEGAIMAGILADNATLASATSARGLLWCARPTSNSSDGTISGEMVQIAGVSYTSSGVKVDPVNSYIGAHLALIHYGWIRTRDDISWKAARGHNVRCIQANGDTPKFYDETE